MIQSTLLPAAALAAFSPQQDPSPLPPVPAPTPVEAPAAAALAAPPPQALDIRSPSPRGARTPGDPFEPFNRRMFKIHEGLDRAILRPAALGYKHAVPRPVRTGLRHVLSNLKEPIVFLNYLLQLKPGKAIETATRFMINSSLGLGGVLDLAKTPGINLPRRPNSFGDTLGFYGVKPGPYLFLPLVGPTDLRDLAGGQADGLVLPLTIGGELKRNRFQIPTLLLAGIDLRAQSDDELKALLDDAIDPYATLRSVYLQDRAGEIAALKGKDKLETPDDELRDPATEPAHSSPVPGLDDPLADPAAEPARPPKAGGAAAPKLDDPLTDPAAAPPPSADATPHGLIGPEAPRK